MLLAQINIGHHTLFPCNCGRSDNEVPNLAIPDQMISQESRKIVPL